MAISTKSKIRKSHGGWAYQLILVWWLCSSKFKKSVLRSWEEVAEESFIEHVACRRMAGHRGGLIMEIGQAVISWLWQAEENKTGIQVWVVHRESGVCAWNQIHLPSPSIQTHCCHLDIFNLYLWPFLHTPLPKSKINCPDRKPTVQSTL